MALQYSKGRVTTKKRGFPYKRRCRRCEKYFFTDRKTSVVCHKCSKHRYLNDYEKEKRFWHGTYLRQCRKCGKCYKTEFRKSKVCAVCSSRKGIPRKKDGEVWKSV